MSRTRILLIHPRDRLLDDMLGLLDREGLACEVLDDPESGCRQIGSFAIVVADLQMLGLQADPLLEKAGRLDPKIPVILLARKRDVSMAIHYMSKGAYHFTSRPVNALEILLIVQRALERLRLANEVSLLRGQLDERYGFDNLLGRTEPMLRIKQKIRQVAAARSTVLITGENGTGKELVARAIHHNSPRKSFPLVVVNSVALSPNLVESELFGHVKGAFTGAVSDRDGKIAAAEGGTLFIDEIGDLSFSIQAKLLRFLENKTFSPIGSNREYTSDVRVVAATNRDLEKMVEEGTFRDDMFYRLNVIRIHLPPLRERAVDIPDLVHMFMENICAENDIPRVPGISPEAMQRLRMYHWPGNVRELKNTIESAVVLTRHDLLDVSDFPPHIMDACYREGPGEGLFTVGMTMAELEREAIARTLKELRGNRTRSAKALGISLRTLQRKIKEYSLE